MAKEPECPPNWPTECHARGCCGKMGVPTVHSKHGVWVGSCEAWWRKKLSILVRASFTKPYRKALIPTSPQIIIAMFYRYGKCFGYFPQKCARIGLHQLSIPMKLGHRKLMSVGRLITNHLFCCLAWPLSHVRMAMFHTLPAPASQSPAACEKKLRQSQERHRVGAATLFPNF